MASGGTHRTGGGRPRCPRGPQSLRPSGRSESAALPEASGPTTRVALERLEGNWGRGAGGPTGKHAVEPDTEAHYHLVLHKETLRSETAFSHSLCLTRVTLSS